MGAAPFSKLGLQVPCLGVAAMVALRLSAACLFLFLGSAQAPATASTWDELASRAPMGVQQVEQPQTGVFLAAKKTTGESAAAPMLLPTNTYTATGATAEALAVIFTL